MTSRITGAGIVTTVNLTTITKQAIMKALPLILANLNPTEQVVFGPIIIHTRDVRGDEVYTEKRKRITMRNAR